MTETLEWISAGLAVAGCLFFIAGSVGLLRLPDVYCRLHALTKADNLGLGLIVAAVALRQEDWIDVVKLLIVWLLVLFTSASVAMLTARAALESGVRPMTRAEEDPC